MADIFASGRVPLLTRPAVVVGIDPGSTTAALAVMALSGQVLQAVRVPITRGKKDEVDGPALLALLQGWGRRYTIQLTIIELVHAMPKQGVSSSFTFGYGAGRLRGLVEAMGWSLQFVSPPDWKKTVMRGISKEGRADSVAFAKVRWPGVDLKGSTHPAAKESHNIADAICLAEYGRWLMVGVIPPSPTIEHP